MKLLNAVVRGVWGFVVLFALVAMPVYGQLPWAATQRAGPVSQASATVNGMVTARGSSTAAWFEWGGDLSYGAVTTLTNIGTSGRVVRLSASVDNLVAGSIYHYRLVASNAFGVAFGADNLFTTGMRVATWYDPSSSIPAIPSGLSNIVAQACGHGHSLAVVSDGTVVAWGVGIPAFYYNYGQANVPAGLTNVVAVAGGWEHSLALRQDGTVSAWGEYTSPLQAAYVPTGLSNVVAIAGGDSHSLALKSDGTVVAWGGNINGQLSIPARLTNVIAIAAGSTHSLALKADGTVVAWRTDPFAAPTTPPPGLSNVVAIASETWHNLALRSDGTVVAWGSNTYGQTNVPAGLSNVIAIAAGFQHSLALKADGTLVAWGNSNYVNSIPAGLTNVAAISSGDYHSLAITSANLPPRAYSRTVAGAMNHDLIISLTGWDPNGDPVRFQISSPPTNGLLYQYTGSGRGAPISSPGTPVADNSRILFSPSPDLFGAPYSTLDFVATDGQNNSSPGIQTINILPPPSIVAAGFVQTPNPGFSLRFSGLSNATYGVQAPVSSGIWGRLGTATQTSPGQFSFVDLGSTNFTSRLYRVISP